MMKICVVFILGLKIGYIAGGGTEVYWRVLERIEKYGDDLTLICKLNETLQTLQTSVRWYKGETLCSFDDQTSYNTKYKAVIVPKGVKLTILNFALEDINETYYCEIGFDKSEKQILSEEMVFRDKSNQSLHDGDNTVVIVLSILGLLVLVVFLRFLWKRVFFSREHLQEKQADLREEEGECVCDRTKGYFGLDRNLCSVDRNDTCKKAGYQLTPTGDCEKCGVDYFMDLEDYSLCKEKTRYCRKKTRWHFLKPFTRNVSNEAHGHGYQKNHTENRKFKEHGGDNSTNFTKVFDENNEVIGPLLNGQSNGKRNSSLNESEDVVQNGGSVVPCTLLNGIGENEDKTDSREERNNITDPKIPHCEPINGEFQYNIQDHQSMPRIPGTEQSNDDSQSSRSNLINTREGPSLSPYRDFSLRIDSFNKPLSFSGPSKSALAEAGFFYKGHENFAECYACGKKQNFKGGENPSVSQFHEPTCCHSKAGVKSSTKPKDVNR